jgi:hypothetical protein
MNRKLVSCMAVSLLALAACEEKKSPPANPAPTKTGSATPDIPGVSPETNKKISDMAAVAKDKAVAGYQATVDEAKKQIDAWTTKLNDAPADKKPEMQSALDKAKAGWEDATKKLADFKSGAATEWQKFSTDVQTSVENLKKQISDGAAQFK